MELRSYPRSPAVRSPPEIANFLYTIVVPRISIFYFWFVSKKESRPVHTQKQLRTNTCKQGKDRRPVLSYSIVPTNSRYSSFILKCVAASDRMYIRNRIFPAARLRGSDGQSERDLEIKKETASKETGTHRLSEKTVTETCISNLFGPFHHLGCP